MSTAVVAAAAAPSAGSAKNATDVKKPDVDVKKGDKGSKNAKLAGPNPCLMSTAGADGAGKGGKGVAVGKGGKEVVPDALGGAAKGRPPGK